MDMTMHKDDPVSFGGSGRIEVITSVERRRRWTTAQKVAIVEETMRPGQSVSSVARLHGIAPNMLFAWKLRMLEGVMWPDMVVLFESLIERPLGL